MIWDDLATGVSYCFVGKVWQHETLKIPNFSKWERGLATTELITANFSTTWCKRGNTLVKMEKLSPWQCLNMISEKSKFALIVRDEGINQGRIHYAAHMLLGPTQ